MANKESSIEYMLNILKTEFGIKNEAELDKAIRKLSVVDLSPFCGEIINQKEAV